MRIANITFRPVRSGEKVALADVTFAGGLTIHGFSIRELVGHAGEYFAEAPSGAFGNVVVSGEGLRALLAAIVTAYTTGDDPDFQVDATSHPVEAGDVPDTVADLITAQMAVADDVARSDADARAEVRRLAAAFAHNFYIE